MTLLKRLTGAVAWSLCGVSMFCAAADGPRIVRLASAPVRPAGEPIREPEATSFLPLAPVVNQRPAEDQRPLDIQQPLDTQRRSEFVPIALPEASPPIASSPVPEFSARPQWESPQVAQRAAPQSPVRESQPSAGPLLASPTASPAPAVERPAAITQQPQPPVVSPQASSILEQSERRSTWAPAAPARAVNNPAIGAVVQRAMQKADQANNLAQRGLLYSARTELVQALQLVAHALDAQESSPKHATALSTGLLAIEEARDFAAASAGPTDAAQVQAIAAGHRTKVFDAGAPIPASPIAAQQAYLGLAQKRFIEAAGQISAASQILYRLGRLETAMAAHDADPLALHGPQAMVFHQAALATDGGNWLAMNELGVLHARYGQLESSKQLLAASVRAHPHAEGWKNLAAVHQRLGETDLAQRAENEWQLVAKKQGASAGSPSVPIQWVDPKTFAATGAQDTKWPAEMATKDAKR